MNKKKLYFVYRKLQVAGYRLEEGRNPDPNSATLSPVTPSNCPLVNFLSTEAALQICF